MNVEPEHADERSTVAGAPERETWGHLWSAMAFRAVHAALHVAFRIRFDGLDLVPASGGALLAYNHVSVLDPLPVGLGAWRRGRRVRFLALTDDFERPGVGWVLRRTGAIPLRRGLGDWSAIEAVAHVVRSGGLAGVSPEGTVGDGTALQTGQRGAARIALLADRPVIPVGVWGTQERWGKEGRRWSTPVRPGLGVAFGPPLDPQGRPRHRPDVIAMTERIMAALAPAVARARELARDRS